MTQGLRLKGPLTSSSKRQQRTTNMVSFCDYEIYLLFLLLVKFHVLGKSEIYSSVQRTLPFFLPCAILSLDTRFPNSFQQCMYFNLNIMLGFQSLDK